VGGVFVCKLERQQCCWLRGHQQQQWEQRQKQLLLLVLCSSSAILDSKNPGPIVCLGCYMYTSCGLD
jgi:hypothetical protein